MVNIFLATANFYKVTEIKAFFADSPEISFSSWLDLPDEEPLDVEETAPDYAGNALLKATATAHHLLTSRARLPLPPSFVLADDSGLEIAALDDFPGVQTARWAGNIPQTAKNNLILAKMQGQTNRSARFIAVLALVNIKTHAQHLFRGVCPGQIATSVSGQAGFGYDPLFLPDLPTTPAHPHHPLTFADLPLEIKNTISHRALALAQLKDYLKTSLV